MGSTHPLLAQPTAGPAGGPHRLVTQVRTPQPNQRRSPATGFRRCVSEVDHPGVALHDRAHDLALHADAPAVDDPQLRQALLEGCVEVVADDVGDLFGPERMKIEGTVDKGSLSKHLKNIREISSRDIAKIQRMALRVLKRGK